MQEKEIYLGMLFQFSEVNTGNFITVLKKAT